MKKFILVIIILGLLVICGIFIIAEKRETDTQPEVIENMEFDYEKSFDVVKNALNCEDRKVDIVLETFDME